MAPGLWRSICLALGEHIRRTHISRILDIDILKTGAFHWGLMNGASAVNQNVEPAAWMRGSATIAPARRR